MCNHTPHHLIYDFDSKSDCHAHSTALFRILLFSAETRDFDQNAEEKCGPESGCKENFALPVTGLHFFHECLFRESFGLHFRHAATVLFRNGIKELFFPICSNDCKESQGSE